MNKAGWRATGWCLVVASAVLLTATPALAGGPPVDPNGNLTVTGPGVGATGPGSGLPVSQPTPGTLPSGTSQPGYTWQDIGPNQQAVCFSDGTWLPSPGGLAGAPNPPPGAHLVGPNPFPELYQLLDPQGNLVGAPVNVCAQPGGPPAPPPPPPPTAAEVAAYTPFPAETIHHNPCYLGLTGLQGGLWATVGNAAVAPVVAGPLYIRGYSVQVAAHPVRFFWSMGNGDGRWGTQSGTHDNPSASYTYEQTGNYPVTLTVTWAGTYTFAGYGVAQTSILPEVAQAPPQRLVWPVQGVTSVLIYPGSVDSSSTTMPAVQSAC